MRGFVAGIDFEGMGSCRQRGEGEEENREKKREGLGMPAGRGSENWHASRKRLGTRAGLEMRSLGHRGRNGGALGKLIARDAKTQRANQEGAHARMPYGFVELFWY